MMKTRLLTLALIASVLTLSACSKKDSETKAIFMKECSNNDTSTTPICSCIYDKLEKTLGEKFLAEAQSATDVRSNQPLMSELKKAATQCVQEQTSSN